MTIAIIEAVKLMEDRRNRYNIACKITKKRKSFKGGIQWIRLPIEN